MKLGEIMSHTVKVVGPNATLEQAARIMKEEKTGMLLVFDGVHIFGVLTDRDITVRATSAGMQPDNTAVYQVMTTDVVTCPMQYEVEEAVKLMIQEQIRRVVVTDLNMCPVGIVSLGDIAFGGEKKKLAAKVIHVLSEDINDA